MSKIIKLILFLKDVLLINNYLQGSNIEIIPLTIFITFSSVHASFKNHSYFWLILEKIPGLRVPLEPDQQCLSHVGKLELC